ncbi:MAG: hypothetical protein ACLFPL_02070 [Candidatus Nanoarchaeia archaeon]
MNKKLILIVIIFLLHLTAIFSATRTISASEPDLYSLYTMENEPNEYKLTGVEEWNLDSSTVTGTGFKQLFVVPKNTEDYVLNTGSIDLDITDTINVNFQSYRYTAGMGEHHLSPGESCEIYLNQVDDDTFSIRSNLNNFKVFSYESGSFVLRDVDITGLSSIERNQFNELLDKYYYIKSNVTAVLYKDGSATSTTIYPNEAQSRAGYSNYVLAKSNSKPYNINFDLLSDTEIEDLYGSGNYEWRIIGEPIDGKCIADDGGVGFGEIVEEVASSFTISSPPPPPINFSKISIENIQIGRDHINYSIDDSDNQITSSGFVNVSFDFQRQSLKSPEEDNMNGGDETLTTTHIANTMGVGEKNTLTKTDIGSSLYDNMYAGNYTVELSLVGAKKNQGTGVGAPVSYNSANATEQANSLKTVEGTTFCQSNDKDCDSVPDNLDMCENEFGSPYYMGCQGEYLPNNASEPLKYKKELQNCDIETNFLGQEIASVHYDTENDKLSCEDERSFTFNILDDYIFNSSGYGYGTGTISNLAPDTYQCRDTGGSGQGLLWTCDLVEDKSQPPLNGISVFDVDKDKLKYYNSWWRDAFTYLDRENEDDCPASFGFSDNNGCVMTNEDSIDRNTTPSGDLIKTDESRMSNKFEFNMNTSEAFLDGNLYTIPSAVTAQVNVNVTSACLPTVRVSELIQNADLGISTPLGLSIANLSSGNEKVRLQELEKVSQLSKTEKDTILRKFTKAESCIKPTIRTDNLTQASLLSTAHLLTPLDNSQQTKDNIESMITTTNQLEINKIISPQDTGSDFKTKIILNIANIPKNTTIWQVIPKESASNITQLLSTVTQGNADEIRLKDKDPIIGWYFGNGGESGDLEFEIEGLGEGGSTVAMNDTIYFNFGELIVNYREIGCFDEENELFTTNSISGSDISTSGKTYSVCIAHNGSDVINSSATITEQFFSIDSNEKFVPNTTGTTNIDVHKNTHSPQKWYSTYIGERPPIDGFSCIGSYDNSGQFGGCMYDIDNRIWMYYGEDNEAPTIDLIYTPSHTINPVIIVDDFISGINYANSWYCVEDSASDCSNSANQIPLTTDIDLTITCPGVEGCEKYIEIYAEDNDGNNNTYTEELQLYQEATACESSCLAVPIPNRYSKSCNGINNCQYYEIPDEDALTGADHEPGSYVAEKCHYRVEGSWVDIGAGLEVQCPNGPTRLSQYSNYSFDVTPTQGCSDVQIDRIPVIFDKEKVILNMIVCNN